MIERSATRSRVNLTVLESAQRQLQSLNQLDEISRQLSLLGDPTRLKILIALAGTQELCVYDLADILEMESSAISHQLRKLLDGGLVTRQRVGTTIYYLIESDKLRDMLATGRALLVEGGR